jgi:hypothetical protein
MNAGRIKVYGRVGFGPVHVQAEEITLTLKGDLDHLPSVGEKADL